MRLLSLLTDATKWNRVPFLWRRMKTPCRKAEVGGPLKFRRRRNQPLKATNWLFPVGSVAQLLRMFPAVRHAVNLICLMAMVFAASAGQMTITNREVRIDGERFVMRGMCYNPA